MANDPGAGAGVVTWELFDEDGNLKASGTAKNKITDIGDFQLVNRTNLIQSSTVSITAVTAANPAVVTTSAAHGFSVGDVVTIAGVTPAYYNGSWAITAVGSATTFSINVGTASTVGTAFGTAKAMANAAPVGMKLGTGSTAVAKNGAGAALTTYLTNSHQVFDATYPSTVSNAGAGGVTTYKVTYAAGKATSASAITEAVIFNDFLADATSSAANTVSRVLLTGIGSKGASDTLALTWTHTWLGA